MQGKLAAQVTFFPASQAATAPSKIYEQIVGNYMVQDERPHQGISSTLGVSVASIETLTPIPTSSQEY